VTTSKARAKTPNALDHLAPQTCNLRLNTTGRKHRDTLTRHSVAESDRFLLTNDQKTWGLNALEQRGRIRALGQRCAARLVPGRPS
jgi:hypothetical protein